MNANEITTMEEVTDVTTEIVTGGTSMAKKVIAGVGGAGLVAFAAYKVVKLISAKRKAKKERLAEDNGEYPAEFEENDVEDEIVEDDE